MFEIITKIDYSEIFFRSEKFMEQFQVTHKMIKMKIALYKIESINNSCQIAVVVNHKEYFEQFENHGFNKKHEGIRKN